MALRILTLAALVQCSAGHDPTDPAENLNSTIAAESSCPNQNVGKFKVNYDQSKCMDIALDGRSGPFNGARVQVWDCTGGRNQDFIWCSNGHIVSAMNKNMCLDVPGGNPYVSSNMEMWECNGSGGQIWGYNSVKMAIYNAKTGLQNSKGMCLDTASGSTARGTSVVNYYAHGSCTAWYAGNSLQPGAGNSSATDRADVVLV
jgi:hypothetical protein